MKQIELEFIEFARLINLSKYDNHSIRFRKLGKHKAGGLYFPYHKTVCIDLESPKSLCHEIGHMIDYTYMPGRLSELYDFKVISNLYEELVTDTINSLSKEDPLYQQFYSKTSKFNKDYYFSSEEIFARTVELYFSKVLNIDSSLLNPKGVYYPTDSTLISCIKDYFDRIF